MSLIYQICSQIRTAYSTQDAYQFLNAFNLNLDDPLVKAIRNEVVQRSEEDLEVIVDNIFGNTSRALAQFVQNYFKYAASSDATCYDEFERFYNSFVPLFSGSDSLFQLPLVKVASWKLVNLAFHVDRNYKISRKQQRADRAANMLSKMFNVMLMDRAPFEESKRQGIFHVTNLAFKIYTKVDNVRLCQTFISNIQKGEINLSDYPMSQQVTYRYYLGRFEFYKNHLRKADEHLTFAFNHCLATSWKNKRLILEYLIPTRIILGYMPTLQLLQKYDLVYPYATLLHALQLGNIKGYMDHLQQNYQYFAKTSSYILLQTRGIVLLWRCLCRRLYIMTRLDEEDRVLPMDQFYHALRFSSQDDTLDLFDIENILVSLISQGYVRGYLHHTQQQMVFSKVNPFPPVSQIHAYQENFNDEAAEEHLKNSQPPIPPEVEQLIEEADASQAHEDDEYIQEEAMYDDMEESGWNDEDVAYYPDENYDESMQ